jgi:hypothetical protein
MTVKALQKQLVKKREQINKLYTEASAIKAQLQGVCDHSEVRDYPYTWSNGFGRHDHLTGHECVFCGWKAPRRDGRFSDPSTWRSQWDDD